MLSSLADERTHLKLNPCYRRVYTEVCMGRWHEIKCLILDMARELHTLTMSDAQSR